MFAVCVRRKRVSFGPRFAVDPDLWAGDTAFRCPRRDITIGPLTASPRRSLNTSRGVISKPDLLCISEAEILEGFSNQDVIQRDIIEVVRHVSSRSTAQELKIDHKTVLNHLRKVGFKKKLDVWVRPRLTPKNMMGRISICEALVKWNEIDPFLKRMVTADEK
ncbi:histone-lysine N-methyltransferase SETMAR [Trichonephila clavipes]|nr:histone-lysine N-methyltransferase SETMAR [Trichonephila clavipes]